MYRTAIATTVIVSFAFSGAVLAQGGDVIICPPVQVNDPLGPDQIDGTGDDDDTDPLSGPKKAMVDPAITAYVGPTGQVTLLAAFTDQSLLGVGGATSQDFTIGFARSFDLGATWQDHDIARGPSGVAEAGALAPPSGSPFSDQWLPIQQHAALAVGGD